MASLPGEAFLAEEPPDCNDSGARVPLKEVGPLPAIEGEALPKKLRRGCDAIQDWIVAEISVNWKGMKRIDGHDTPIQRDFERVLEVNAARGYALHSFQLARVMTGNLLNETIVAVFRFQD